MYQHHPPQSLKSPSSNEGYRDRCARLPSATCQPVLWNSGGSCQAPGISKETRSSFQRARALTVSPTTAQGTDRQRLCHYRADRTQLRMPGHSHKPQHCVTAQRSLANSTERWQGMPVRGRLPVSCPSDQCSVECPPWFVSASPASWNALSWRVWVMHFLKIIPLSSFPNACVSLSPLMSPCPQIYSCVSQGTE